MNRKSSKKSNYNFPLYCDYSCKYALFGKPSAVGACRKELAVWCKYFKKYNNKNNKCLSAL
ncbi:MAG: hypothetical protein WHS65_11820 [Melioribacteraceae bacterium]